MIKPPDYEGYDVGYTDIDSFKAHQIAKSIPEAKFLYNVVDKGDVSVLEVGCGNGRLLIQLGNLGYYGSLVGIDTSHSRIEFARQWAKDLKLDIKFKVSGVIPKIAHDLIIMNTGVFQYFAPLGTDGKMLSDVSNALKIDGTLVMELYKIPKYRLKALRQSGQIKEWYKLHESDAYTYSLDDYKYFEEQSYIMHTKTFISKDGTVDAGRVEWLKYYNTYEILDLLGVCFESVTMFSNWDMSPYIPSSERMIIVATRKYT